MRVVVTGTTGQVALSLLERGHIRGIDVIPIGRPALDFEKPDTIRSALLGTRPDVIVNAAAFTAVDVAETEEALATQINGKGAGEVAAQAARQGVPIIHLSTDYVFNGLMSRPYREDDEINPVGAYGRSKSLGERAVVEATNDHVILRTAWVFSPFSKNFVRTMLSLGQGRSLVNVVDDQFGNPTYALDLADGILTVASSLVSSPRSRDLLGVFHMAGQGDATWADVAEVTFETALAAGFAPVHVKRVTSAKYLTPANRPANSRLDCGKLEERYGIVLPAWRESLRICAGRLLALRQGGP